MLISNSFFRQLVKTFVILDKQVPQKDDFVLVGYSESRSTRFLGMKGGSSDKQVSKR